MKNDWAAIVRHLLEKHEKLMNDAKLEWVQLHTNPSRLLWLEGEPSDRLQRGVDHYNRMRIRAEHQALKDGVLFNWVCWSVKEGEQR